MGKKSLWVGLAFQALCAFGVAAAGETPWLTVNPPIPRAGDTVVFTLTGPAGYRAALASSGSNFGAGDLGGQEILLGSDYAVVATGSVGSNGAWTSTFKIPAGTVGLLSFQGAVWPATGPKLLSNGAGVFVSPPSASDIAVAELGQQKQYSCGSPTASDAAFWATIVGQRPVREATMRTPGGAVYSMWPARLDEFAASGYPHAMFFEYGGADALSYFPDGTYVFTAVFPDGTSATASAVLSGTFPSPITVTTPACDAAGVSRGPLVQFSATGADRFSVKVDADGVLWRYDGESSTVTVPERLLPPQTDCGIKMYAAAPRTGAAIKSILVSNHVTTGP